MIYLRIYFKFRFRLWTARQTSFFSFRFFVNRLEEFDNKEKIEDFFFEIVGWGRLCAVWFVWRSESA